MTTSFTDWGSGAYLAHHGVLGQKWGVRRYQNRDGTLTKAGKERYLVNVSKVNKQIRRTGQRSPTLREAHTIPKGTAIYRATVNNNEDGNGTTYVSYLDADRHYYRGNGWIKATAGHGDFKLYENTYSLKEDIHVPSREETANVVNEVLRKNKDLVRSTVEAWAKTAMPEYSMSWKEYLWNNGESGKTEKQIRKEYCDEVLKNYGHMSANEAAFFAMQSFGVNKPVRDKVFAELKKRGYNAMTDEASVGGQNGYAKEGADPLIIFDQKGLLEKRSTTEVSSQDEHDSMRKYNNIMSKARQSRHGQWSDL